MATMRSDELNIVGSEQVVEKNSVLDIDTFFDGMYLTDSEKEERKDLARNIFIVLSAILTIISANNVLGNEHDTQYYEDYVRDNLQTAYRNAFGNEKYNSQVSTFAKEFVDSTMRHINETPYFTSEERAIVNAETQTNSAFNRNQYEEAIERGKTKKVWVTMHDARVRKTHVAADEQETDIDKPFVVGSSLMQYPCDPDGHAKEIVNCRCTCIYK